MVTQQFVVAWINRLAEIYHENREYLTQLDAAIGDADHGTNMVRGFAKAVDKVGTMESQSIGDILKAVGMVLVNSVGGASGPLYGTFFMRAGMAIGDQEQLDAQAVVSLFEAGLDGVLQRGKATPGDKTMVDAMDPGLRALKASVHAGQPLEKALQSAALAAEAGMKATIPLKAQKGRASYLGERSIGHQDPGATSTYYLFKSAYDVWGKSTS